MDQQDNVFIHRQQPSNSSTPSHRSTTSISRTQSSSSTSFNVSSQCQTTKNIRSLALVDSIEFEFKGNNMNKHALAVGDCDNDEKNELLIGTLNGELLIYKNDYKNAYASTKDLGMIACVLIGDILNVGTNYIISISIEGYLKIFHMHSSDSQIDQHSNDSNVMKRQTSKSSSNIKLPPTISDNEIYSSVNNLVLIHSQHMQSNTMSALLVDFDHDDNLELLVALSDRVVRCYRAIHFNDEIKLIGLYKWEFSDQIGSISLHYSNNQHFDDDNDNKYNNRIYILVAQSGGVFAKITCCSDEHLVDNENGENENNDADNEPMSVEYCDALVSLVRNRQTSAEILSNIQHSNNDEKLIALATHDGTLILMAINNSDDQQKIIIKWHVQLENPILSIHKYDLNNDENDELIVTTWNGIVYVIDLDDNQMITCHYHQPISAFTVGRFHLNDHIGQINCFIYATFTNTIQLFYNIESTLFIHNDNDDCNDDDDDGYPIQRYIRQNNSQLYEQMNQLLKKYRLSSPSLLIRTILYELPMNE